MIYGIGLAVRFITFISLLTIVGAISFRTLVLQRSAVAGETLDAASDRSARTALGAALLLLPLAFLKLALQTAAMRFPDDSWIAVGTRLVMQTHWGRTWIANWLFVVLLIPALVAARKRGLARWLGAAFVAVALIGTQSLSSHAMSAQRFGNFAIIADAFHLLGSGFWLGTLAMMFLSVQRGDGLLADNNSGAYLILLLERFSPLALVGTGLVVASGLVSALAHIQAIPELMHSQYGLTLLAKVASVAVVVVFGWRNWKYVTPRLLVDGPERMTRAMFGELLATLLVLLVTAALVVTAPPVMDMPMP